MFFQYLCHPLTKLNNFYVIGSSNLRNKSFLSTKNKSARTKLQEDKEEVYDTMFQIF